MGSSRWLHARIEASHQTNSCPDEQAYSCMILGIGEADICSRARKICVKWPLHARMADSYEKTQQPLLEHIKPFSLSLSFRPISDQGMLAFQRGLQGSHQLHQSEISIPALLFQSWKVASWAVFGSQPCNAHSVATRTALRDNENGALHSAAPLPHGILPSTFHYLPILGIPVDELVASHSSPRTPRPHSRQQCIDGLFQGSESAPAKWLVCFLPVLAATWCSNEQLELGCQILVSRNLTVLGASSAWFTQILVYCIHISLYDARFAVHNVNLEQCFGNQAKGEKSWRNQSSSTAFVPPAFGRWTWIFPANSNLKWGVEALLQVPRQLENVVS